MKRASYMIAVLALTISILCPSCAIRKQENALKNAKYAVAATGIGVDVAQKAAAEHFEEFPAEDTEKYCQGEIALFIFQQEIIGRLHP